MHIRLLRAVVGLTVVGLVSVSGIASAGTLIETTVTIKTQNGDFWGKVVSLRPKLCAKDRKVVVFKQLGAEQHPATDEKIANDMASLSGGVVRVEHGEHGRHERQVLRPRGSDDQLQGRHERDGESQAVVVHADQRSAGSSPASPST